MAYSHLDQQFKGGGRSGDLFTDNKSTVVQVAEVQYIDHELNHSPGVPFAKYQKYIDSGDTRKLHKEAESARRIPKIPLKEIVARLTLLCVTESGDTVAVTVPGAYDLVTVAIIRTESDFHGVNLDHAAAEMVKNLGDFKHWMGPEMFGQPWHELDRDISTFATGADPHDPKKGLAHVAFICIPVASRTAALEFEKLILTTFADEWNRSLEHIGKFELVNSSYCSDRIELASFKAEYALGEHSNKRWAEIWRKHNLPSVAVSSEARAMNQIGQWSRRNWYSAKMKGDSDMPIPDKPGVGYGSFIEISSSDAKQTRMVDTIANHHITVDGRRLSVVAESVRTGLMPFYTITFDLEWLTGNSQKAYMAGAATNCRSVFPDTTSIDNPPHCCGFMRTKHVGGVIVESEAVVVCSKNMMDDHVSTRTHVLAEALKQCADQTFGPDEQRTFKIKDQCDNEARVVVGHNAYDYVCAKKLNIIPVMDGDVQPLHRVVEQCVNDTIRELEGFMAYETTDMQKLRDDYSIKALSKASRILNYYFIDVAMGKCLAMLFFLLDVPYEAIVDTETLDTLSQCAPVLAQLQDLARHKTDVRIDKLVVKLKSQYPLACQHFDDSTMLFQAIDTLKTMTNRILDLPNIKVEGHIARLRVLVVSNAYKNRFPDVNVVYLPLYNANVELRSPMFDDMAKIGEKFGFSLQKKVRLIVCDNAEKLVDMCIAMLVATNATVICTHNGTGFDIPALIRYKIACTTCTADCASNKRCSHRMKDGTLCNADPTRISVCLTHGHKRPYSQKKCAVCWNNETGSLCMGAFLGLKTKLRGFEVQVDGITMSTTDQLLYDSGHFASNIGFPGKIHADTMDIPYERMHTKDGMGLDALGKLVLGHGKSGIGGAAVTKYAYLHKSHGPIWMYAVWDVGVTLLLYSSQMHGANAKVMSAITQCCPQYCVEDHRQNIKAMSMLCNDPYTAIGSTGYEFKEVFDVHCKNKGGMVYSPPETAVVTNVMPYLDFSAMYPTIVQSFGISQEGLVTEKQANLIIAKDPSKIFHERVPMVRGKATGDRDWAKLKADPRFRPTKTAANWERKLANLRNKSAHLRGKELSVCRADLARMQAERDDELRNTIETNAYFQQKSSCTIPRICGEMIRKRNGIRGQAAIDKLQIKQLERDMVKVQAETCNVCRLPMTNVKLGARITACGHTFHNVCLADWRETCGVCPVCHEQITDTEPYTFAADDVLYAVFTSTQRQIANLRQKVEVASITQLCYKFFNNGIYGLWITTGVFARCVVAGAIVTMLGRRDNRMCVEIFAQQRGWRKSWDMCRTALLDNYAHTSKEETYKWGGPAFDYLIECLLRVGFEEGKIVPLQAHCDDGAQAGFAAEPTVSELTAALVVQYGGDNELVLAGDHSVTTACTLADRKVLSDALDVYMLRHYPQDTSDTLDVYYGDTDSILPIIRPGLCPPFMRQICATPGNHRKLRLAWGAVLGMVWPIMLKAHEYFKNTMADLECEAVVFSFFARRGVKKRYIMCAANPWDWCTDTFFTKSMGFEGKKRDRADVIRDTMNELQDVMMGDMRPDRVLQIIMWHLANIMHASGLPPLTFASVAETCPCTCMGTARTNDYRELSKICSMRNVNDGKTSRLIMGSKKEFTVDQLTNSVKINGHSIASLAHVVGMKQKAMYGIGFQPGSTTVKMLPFCQYSYYNADGILLVRQLEHFTMGTTIDAETEQVKVKITPPKSHGQSAYYHDINCITQTTQMMPRGSTANMPHPNYALLSTMDYSTIMTLAAIGVDSDDMMVLLNAAVAFCHKQQAQIMAKGKYEHVSFDVCVEHLEKKLKASHRQTQQKLDRFFSPLPRHDAEPVVNLDQLSTQLSLATGVKNIGEIREDKLPTNIFARLGITPDTWKQLKDTAVQSGNNKRPQSPEVLRSPKRRVVPAAAAATVPATAAAAATVPATAAAAATVPATAAAAATVPATAAAAATVPATAAAAAPTRPPTIAQVAVTRKTPITARVAASAHAAAVRPTSNITSITAPRPESMQDTVEATTVPTPHIRGTAKRQSILTEAEIRLRAARLIECSTQQTEELNRISDQSAVTSRPCIRNRPNDESDENMKKRTRVKDSSA